MALTMVGAGAGAAFADETNQINPDADASLTIHKYAGSAWANQPENGTAVTAPEDAEPLEGVTFRACPVEGLSVTEQGDWATITALNTAINNDGTHAFPTVGFDGVTLGDCVEGTTDENGEITWAMDLGVYYVTEIDAPSTVVARVLPFLVTIPMAHNSDSTWIYDVHVYPKNAVNELEKEAVDPGPLGVGDKIEWNVINSMPPTDQDFTSYMLLDKLDPRLQYVEGSSVITIDGSLLTPCVDADDPTGCGFNVTVDDQNLVKLVFTAAGLAALDAAADDGYDVEWTFETTVLSIGDGTIENQAVVWANNPDGDWETGKPTDPVESKWGAVTINKIDNKGGSALEGAIFQVFGSEADAQACVDAVKAAKGTLVAGCDNAITVYRDADGNVIADPGQNQFTTGVDGSVTIPGLNVGIDDDASRNYWLVEIVPPAGYVNAEVSYPVVVSPGALTEATTETVNNAQEPPTTLPNTGAVVSGILVIAAIALGGGCIFLIASSRRKANQD